MNESLKSDRSFIPHLHAFRGFAIINIVFIHCWVTAIYFVKPSAPVTKSDTFQGAINEALFHGSTLYFTLISGILFSIILRQRPWKKFFASKAQNVVLPYVFVTLVYSLVIWPMGPSNPVKMANLLEFISFIQSVFKNVFAGTAMFHLWYMPILIILFLCTPVIDFLLRNKQSKWLLILIIAAPLIVSRTSGLDIDIPTVTYFLGAYTLGIYMGVNYTSVIECLERKLLPLVVIAALLTIALSYGHLKNLGDLSIVSPLETMHYIHKICIAGVALVMLKRWENSLPNWLMKMGDYSFPIYFLHGIWLYGLSMLMTYLLTFAPTGLSTFLVGITMLIASIGGSVLTVCLFKLLFKKKSKYLIGV